MNTNDREVNIMDSTSTDSNTIEAVADFLANASSSDLTLVLAKLDIKAAGALGNRIEAMEADGVWGEFYTFTVDVEHGEGVTAVEATNFWEAYTRGEPFALESPEMQALEDEFDLVIEKGEANDEHPEGFIRIVRKSGREALANSNQKEV